LVDKWWESLESEGFVVALFSTDPTAIEAAQRVIGPMLWSDSIIADDFGGMVTIDEIRIWVTARRAPPGHQSDSDRRPVFFYTIARPMNFLSRLTRPERTALDKLGKALQRKGIHRTVGFTSLFRWVFKE
jgi:hypothetical protein